MFSKLMWRHGGGSASTIHDTRNSGDTLGRLNRQSSEPHRRSTIATMYNRNFHQNPDRPWQYYMDSGSKELQHLMLLNKDDTTVGFSTSSSVTSEDRSRSVSIGAISEKVHINGLTIGDIVKAPPKTSTNRIINNDSLDIDESDDDDRSMSVTAYFIAPEGVNLIPFSCNHSRSNFQHSIRLSSVYNANKSDCRVRSSELLVTVDNLSPLRFHADQSFKFDEMNATPHNSPIRGAHYNGVMYW